MEVWKDIAGYEGLYQVSNLGHVKNIGSNKFIPYYNGRIRKPIEHRDGYLFHRLSKDKKRKNHYLHRLVAEAFIPNPENKAKVNHINGNKHDNRVENLEWVSQKENIAHAYSTGLNGPEHMRNRKGSSAVEQYSENMVFIRMYPSMAEAERQTGIDAALISRSIKKGHKCHGYIWKKV